jgi:flagellar motor switch protein FliN/FliY
MTSTLSAEVGALLETAAAAATAGLTIGEPTSYTELSAEDEFAGAVSVSFTGSRSGELALMVDAALLQAVTQNGAVDIASALRPAIAAVAGAIGDITTGIPAEVDPTTVRAKFGSYADSGAVAVRGASSVRAAIMLGLEGGAQPARTTTVSADRLDLLRGVEMQASAELGRTRMTVNELLNLRAGAVVELDRAAGDPVDLFVNGRLMARGEVVVVDENYAVRITAIVTDDNAR